jgi:hypothetical protein
MESTEEKEVDEEVDMWLWTTFEIIFAPRGNKDSARQQCSLVTCVNSPIFQSDVISTCDMPIFLQKI